MVLIDLEKALTEKKMRLRGASGANKDKMTVKKWFLSRPISIFTRSCRVIFFANFLFLVFVVSMALFFLLLLMQSDQSDNFQFQIH
ncbi:hypothetical protein D6810_02370 [Candidatus Dojkabacteria bacterium]|uniref:Uncharacterized protein n=1 Tax=Candidatus Dojkabacteria bacterium TaxID=2099670 RepID=A0A3M0YXY1_9BACT|nr:MAG: hypothetical protein D6810_02370 [Candidatus Dojkabacteria bacterium]